MINLDILAAPLPSSLNRNSSLCPSFQQAFASIISRKRLLPALETFGESNLAPKIPVSKDENLRSQLIP